MLQTGAWNTIYQITLRQAVTKHHLFHECYRGGDKKFFPHLVLFCTARDAIMMSDALCKWNAINSYASQSGEGLSSAWVQKFSRHWKRKVQFHWTALNMYKRNHHISVTAVLCLYINRIAPLFQYNILFFFVFKGPSFYWCTMCIAICKCPTCSEKVNWSSVMTPTLTLVGMGDEVICMPMLSRREGLSRMTFLNSWVNIWEAPRLWSRPAVMTCGGG